MPDRDGHIDRTFSLFSQLLHELSAFNIQIHENSSNTNLERELGNIHHKVDSLQHDFYDTLENHNLIPS